MPLAVAAAAFANPIRPRVNDFGADGESPDAKNSPRTTPFISRSRADAGWPPGSAAARWGRGVPTRGI